MGWARLALRADRLDVPRQLIVRLVRVPPADSYPILPSPFSLPPPSCLLDSATCVRSASAAFCASCCFWASELSPTLTVRLVLVLVLVPCILSPVSRRESQSPRARAPAPAKHSQSRRIRVLLVVVSYPAVRTPGSWQAGAAGPDPLGNTGPGGGRSVRDVQSFTHQGCVHWTPDRREVPVTTRRKGALVLVRDETRRDDGVALGLGWVRARTRTRSVTLQVCDSDKVDYCSDEVTRRQTGHCYSERPLLH
jgi:hypothetical protein